MADDSGVWVKIVPDDFGGAAIGDWATIKEVTGNPTRYEYPEDNPEWVAFEWTDTTDPSPNSLTTQAGGIVEALVVSGGQGASMGSNVRGQAGNVVSVPKLYVDEDPIPVVVGSGGIVSYNAWQITGKQSSLGDLIAPPSYGLGGGSYPRDGSGGVGHGLTSSITGNSIEYAMGDRKTPRPSKGDGGSENPNVAGTSGVVIVRVPAEYDNTQGQGSTPATVVAAVEKAKETAKETIKRNRRNR